MNFAIIAAGEGSRMSGTATATPKPLVEIGSEPMIGRLVRILRREGGTGPICVIVNPAMPRVGEYLRSLPATPSEPLSIVEEATAGSFESFCRLSREIDTSGPLCLLTVDTIFRPEEFRRFIADFEADTAADGYMAVTDYIADEKPLYVATTPSGEIAGFLDNPHPGVDLVSGGIYALRPDALALLSDCRDAGISRMRDFQRALVAAGMRLKGWKFSRIIDVDHPADLSEARRFLAITDNPIV